MTPRQLLWLSTACLVIASLVSNIFITTRPVQAIGNPSYISIGYVGVFKDLWQTGDQLFFVRYDVRYASVPSEDPTTTYQMCIYNTTGTVLLYTRALNYYQHNIISIYLTASQALTWGAGYYIKIMGNPAVFPVITEGVNMRTWIAQSGDYIGAGSANLATAMIVQATALQTDWGITLLNTQNLFNATGVTYMDKAIPGFSGLCSTYCVYSSSVPVIVERNFTKAYEPVVKANQGPKLGAALAGIGGFFGISGDWAGMWFGTVIVAVFCGIVYTATRSSVAALAVGLPGMVFAVWMGIGLPDLMTMLAIVVVVLAVLFGIVFILARFA